MARWLLLPDLPRPVEQICFRELRATATNLLHFCLEEEGKSLSYVHSQEPRFWRVPVAVGDLPLSLTAVQGSHGQVKNITMAEVVPWHRMRSLGHPVTDRVQLKAKSLHKSFLIFIIEMAQAIIKGGHKASYKEETKNNSE